MKKVNAIEIRFEWSVSLFRTIKNSFELSYFKMHAEQNIYALDFVFFLLSCSFRQLWTDLFLYTITSEFMMTQFQEKWQSMFTITWRKNAKNPDYKFVYIKWCIYSSLAQNITCTVRSRSISLFFFHSHFKYILFV